MASELIRKIEKIQVEKGMSDKEMAKKLGCSRQLYQKTRNNNIPLGKRILRGICVAFPELQPDILFFLTRDANRLPDSANTTSQNRGKDGESQ